MRPPPRGTVAFGACLEKKIVGEGILGRAPLDQFLFRGREHRLQLPRDGLREFRLSREDVREIFIVGLFQIASSVRGLFNVPVMRTF